jgi:hypothetical protein
MVFFMCFTNQLGCGADLIGRRRFEPDLNALRAKLSYLREMAAS